MSIRNPVPSSYGIFSDLNRFMRSDLAQHNCYVILGIQYDGIQELSHSYGVEIQFLTMFGTPERIIISRVSSR